MKASEFFTKDQQDQIRDSIREAEILHRERSGFILRQSFRVMSLTGLHGSLNGLGCMALKKERDSFLSCT
jgi:hypothetical protein